MQHVWLSSIGVWAQVRGITPEDGSMRAAEHSHGFTSGTDHDDESANLASSDAGGSSSRARVHERTNRGLFWSIPDRDTGGDEDYQGTNNRERGCSDDHMQNECHHYDSNEYCRTCDESLPSCPICLSSINLRKVAILRWCMHRFCLPCIEKWSSMQQFCPLCKQTFRGWYYDIQSSSKFEKRDMTIRSKSNHSNQHRAHGTRQRVFWNSNFRSRYSVLRPRTFKSLPRIRTFGGMSGHGENNREVEHLNQALQWRSHIYKRNLRAVPLALNSRVKANEVTVDDPERKARIERRLEPWIRRELQAIAGDLDHSLVVHLVLALWLHFLTKRDHMVKDDSLQQQNRVAKINLEDVESIRQLEPFLEEKASTFWHELRCFAESPYSMRAYDSVTKYVKY